LGWIALVFYLLAVAMALLKLDPYGFACVAVAGVLSVVAMGLEYRQRKHTRQAADRGDEQVFSAGGTFGAPRSSQTHTRMM
jgi:hypothetical protein